MWIEKKPEFGDQIKVDRGLYSHHGIYESDERVYHFAAPQGVETNPENARVIVTDLDTFLKGGILEVREYTEEELKNKRAPNEIVEYAKAHLGEDGYNLISNNCEHFSNRCAFGVSENDQVNNIFSMLGRLFS